MSLVSLPERGVGGSSIARVKPPLCPDCGQPASSELAGLPHEWECRNEACPEFGQPVLADEPPSSEPNPGDADAGRLP